MSKYHIQRLDESDVDTWLSFDGCVSAEDSRDLVNRMRSNPSIERYILYSNDSPLSRFSLEIDLLTMTCWWPTHNRCVRAEQLTEIHTFIIEYLIRYFHELELSLLESKLKLTNNVFLNWYRCMLDRGMQHLSTKREYELSTNSPPPFHENRPVIEGLEIVDRFDSDSQFNALYLKTLHGSPDKADLFEASLGIPHSEYSHVFCLTVEDDPVGLQTFLVDNDSLEVWTTYVGVVPEWREKGLGYFVVSEGINHFYAQGSRTFKALIDKNNFASIRVHESLGYDACGDDIVCLLYG